MQMEADREGLATARPHQFIFPPQLLACCREVEPAMMDEPEALLIAVMAQLDLEIAIVLRPPAQHDGGTVAEPAVREYLAGIGILDHEGGMRRRQPLRRAPLWIAGMCPAMYDQALAPEAHLEARRTGMRMCVGPRTWRPAAIH